MLKKSGSILLELTKYTKDSLATYSVYRCNPSKLTCLVDEAKLIHKLTYINHWSGEQGTILRLASASTRLRLALTGTELHLSSP